jgi:hypothetical protein
MIVGAIDSVLTQLNMGELESLLQNENNLSWNIQLYLTYDPMNNDEMAKFAGSAYKWFMIVLEHDNYDKLMEMFYYA